MNALEPNADAGEASPLARLLAGGRHVRLLIAWQPPVQLVLPAVDHCERVVRLARAGHPVPGSAAADPLRLPFVEAVFDRMLVTTALPVADARAELRELWRVLAPAGLALLVVQARRRWQFRAAGWHRDGLGPLLDDAMFEVLDWQVESLPERWHLVLVAKRDGLRPALVGRVSAALVPAPSA